MREKGAGGHGPTQDPLAYRDVDISISFHLKKGGRMETKISLSVQFLARKKIAFLAELEAYINLIFFF